MILDGLNYLVTRSTQEIVRYLIEDNNITIEDALDIVYNSQTFDLLCDLGTHLYYESPAYVYEMLKEEINQKQK